MSSRRVVVMGVAAWLAVVTVGSVLVWAVIGRVGQHLESSEEPLVGASNSPVAMVTPGGARSGRSDHPTPRPHRHPASVAPTSAAPTPTLPSAPSSTAGPTPGVQPSTAPQDPTHDATPHPSSPPTHSGPSSGPSSGSGGSPTATPPQRRTWSGAPGLVTAECRSTQVSLVAAQPASGYQVEVEERGPARLLVQFEGTSDGHEGQTIVAARCMGGAPTFAVGHDD